MTMSEPSLATNASTAQTAHKKRIQTRLRFLDAINHLASLKIITQSDLQAVAMDGETFSARCCAVDWITIETVPGGWRLIINKTLRDLTFALRNRADLGGTSLLDALQSLQREIVQRRKDNNDKRAGLFSAHQIDTLQQSQLLNDIEEKLAQFTQGEYQQHVRPHIISRTKRLNTRSGGDAQCAAGSSGRAGDQDNTAR
jgi:hypothetical protein